LVKRSKSPYFILFLEKIKTSPKINLKTSPKGLKTHI